MNFIKWIAIVSLLFAGFYLAGPRAVELFVDATPLPFVNSSLQELEKNIRLQEGKVKHLKSDNQARIVWKDSLRKQKTPYAIVYIHGFSASQAEGYPVHRHLAKRYGCNLFLSRLYAHGLDEKEPLLEMTAEKMISSAKQAIAIGKQLGDSVILISTSTGGTLSLMLASVDSHVAGLVLYSPNIDLYDKKSFLLTKPWGLEIARLVIGDRYYRFEAPPAAQHYWNTKYRIEALIELKRLINTSMNEKTFKMIHQPVFLGYYYKDESHQDDVVSVSRMLEMYDQLGTHQSMKRKVPFPNAGFHVIASSYWSSNTKTVELATNQFLEEVMHLSPLNN